ncbi:unnamed protein product [Anisakis simplex]|uniref:Phosphatase and actin regulator 2 n=1 Tax=Anisakis simplex TaxID=6269 RepID=A0A158PNA2_ANISI|nr:unnamed protein product [Anisakis simplex]
MVGGLYKETCGKSASEKAVFVEESKNVDGMKCSANNAVDSKEDDVVESSRLSINKPHTAGEHSMVETLESSQHAPSHSPKSSKSHPKHSRAFGDALRTTRFWMRLLRPWKWRRKGRKSNLRRSNSDRSPLTNQIATTIPTSFSSVEPIHLTAVEHEQQKAVSWDGSLDSLRIEESEANNCQKEADPPSVNFDNSDKSNHNSVLRLTTQQINISTVERVVVAYNHSVSCTDGNVNIENGDDSNNGKDKVSLADGNNARNDGDDQGQLIEWDTDSQCDDTAEMDNDKVLIEEVAAKEPDLTAKPNKPVLKKLGAPSRSKVYKVQPSDGLIDQHYSSNFKSVRTSNDELPSRLTDDSDSDSDIKYRDDGPSSFVHTATRHLGFGRSTNPVIASRLMPQCSFDADDTDESEWPVGGLAAKVLRKDTFARRLDVDAPDPVDDIPNQTSDDRRRLMHKVSIKLERKLSERPSVEELEQRNILKSKDDSISSKKAMDETRKMLLRKLSFRPTIQELKDKQIIKFNDYVEVTEAEVYDRKADKPWTRLTAMDKALIRKELNDFKATEMDVHEESRIFTRLLLFLCHKIPSSMK